MRTMIETGVFQRQYGHIHTDPTLIDQTTLDTLARQDWKTGSACTSTRADDWFAEPGTQKSRRAATLCAACPVRDLCLAAALVYDEKFGVWGGLDAAQRRPLASQLEHGVQITTIVRDARSQRAVA